jgi:hypothetical protein
VSSSDEFNDPFSEDAGGGLLEMEGGRNIQGAKITKGRRVRITVFSNDDSLQRTQLTFFLGALGALEVSLLHD